ncbi:MAG TPA: efflux RND transporter periplasmic adaptor subunit, partial [Planctomycetaceae bacterium]|nr:efflux RND transporter periplasmic adaptor subunit [Planctomycetaceae bacterium]
ARSAEANIKVERARQTQAEADRTHAVAQLKVAEASLRQTEILIDYATIKAPYAGVITRRWANTGDFVRSAADGQSEPLFTLVKVDPLRIVTDIPENDSSLIHDEQPATLTIDALKGRPFAGRVRRSAGVLDPKTRTLRVEVELDKPDPQLRPGMYGALTITLAERKQAILVPSRSLRFQGDQAFVLIAAKGKAEKRPVTIGFNDGNRAEIVDGLSPTDQVIAESRSPLSPGQPVEATPARVNK